MHDEACLTLDLGGNEVTHRHAFSRERNKNKEKLDKEPREKKSNWTQDLQDHK